MPIAAMADDATVTSARSAHAGDEGDPGEPGARVPKDAVDPELVKLSRARPRVTVLTSAGVVFLAVFFLFKLDSDRRFGGESSEPRRVAVADIVKGAIDDDAHVIVDAEPLMSHAIRSATTRGNIGMRVVPARGSSQKLWLVLPGDGWTAPSTLGHAGRLRALDELPVADSIGDYLANNPRPLFAPAAAVRAGFATNRVPTVSGDEITLRDSDRVGFDVIDPSMARVLCSYNERHKTTIACHKALVDAGVPVTGTPIEGREQATFLVSASDALATTLTKLEGAGMWGTHVEPVTQHYETTWGKLKASGPTGLTVDAITVPDSQLDLIGLYVARTIPAGAFALLVGEKPQDYWYVLPVTIIVGLIALLFAWAFVRAVKRDLLPARA
jgi:hypothetical protein